MKRILPVFLLLAAGAFANVDNGLIVLIPANSKLVAGIDLVQCRSSQFGQYLLSKSQADDAHFEQFMTQTGFDPRRDLDSVILTSLGDSGKNSSFVILGRGNFDQNKITALAISKGAVASVYQGVSLLVNKDKGQQVALAFPSSDVAVMGDLASVHQVIQNLTAPVSLDVDLTNRIDKTGSANDAWFVSATGGSMLGKEFSATTGGQFSGQMQALQSIHEASGGVKFGSTVAVTLDAATRSAQDATSLSDVFRFAASMVQMQRQQDPRAGILASAVDNMQLATNGPDVHVAFSMTEKNLEQMAELAPGKK